MSQAARNLLDGDEEMNAKEEGEWGPDRSAS